MNSDEKIPIEEIVTGPETATPWPFRFNRYVFNLVTSDHGIDSKVVMAKTPEDADGIIMLYMISNKKYIGCLHSQYVIS